MTGGIAEVLEQQGEVLEQFNPSSCVVRYTDDRVFAPIVR